MSELDTAVLTCEGLRIDYKTPGGIIRVLTDFDIEVGRDPVAVMGPSGSGKSSLLRCMAGLQTPASGSVTLDGVHVEDGGDPRASMIFQDHGLIEFLDVSQNLRLAAELRGQTIDRGGVAEILELVGLGDYESRMPATLSGGQAQRVAIARALTTGSRLLLADEPTGALDEDNSLRIARVLKDVAASRGVALVVATHDQRVADVMGRVVRLDQLLHISHVEAGRA